MLDRGFIGWRAPPVTLDVERGQVRLFCEAIGETNPIYLDDAAARAAGYPAMPVPPTFGFSLKATTGQPFDYLVAMGTDIGKLLHGEQSFEHHVQLYVGDRVVIATEILNIESRAGGRFDAVRVRTDLANQHGQLCVRLTSNFLVRNEPADAAS